MYEKVWKKCDKSVIKVWKKYEKVWKKVWKNEKICEKWRNENFKFKKSLIKVLKKVKSVEKVLLVRNC